MRHALLRPGRLLPATLFVVTAAAAVPTRGAAPTVDFLYPAGGRQGSTVTLTVGATKADAKIEGWPARAVCDTPGLTFEAGKENGAFTVTIAADAPVGPHLVRVVNAEGSSDLRPFYVGRHAEQVEPEPPPGNKPPKGEPDGPLPVAALPAVLNGRLAKSGESDAWAVDVTEAGRWLVAEVTCRRLGAPVDPLLQLLDPDGTVVAFNHDTFGLDPLLAYRPTRPGRYTLVVAGFAHPPAADVKFAGSRAAVYRLAVTDGPYARHAFPAVAPRGAKSAVRLLGWNLPDGRGAEPNARVTAGDAADAVAGDGRDPGVPAEVDARGTGADAAFAPVAGVRLDNEFQVRLSDLSAGSVAQAPAAASPAGLVPLPPLPAAVNGRLGRPGAIDRFTLVAKKDDRLTASVVARAVYSPIDPVLTVTGPMGAELARNDDQANDKLDPRVEWTAPHDGTYTIAVADLARRGGPGCVYHLEVGPPIPSFAATVGDHDRAVAAGKSVDLKVTVARTGGYDKPLKVRAADLPPGVAADPVEVPAKGGAATVKLAAAADAPPGGHPFRLVVVGDGDGTAVARPVTFALPADVVPPTTSTLWLTVTAPPAKK